MNIEASGKDTGGTGETLGMLGLGFVLGSSFAGCSCGGTAADELEAAALGPLRAKREPHMPLLLTTDSDVDEALPTLSASDGCWLAATDGAADVPLDQRPVREGVLRASCPVEADNASDCPDSVLEAVFEDIVSLVRLASDNRLTC